MTDALLPNKEDSDSTKLNFAITGATASPLGASLVSAWNGNDLGTYLGLSTPPPNLIEAFFSRPRAFGFFPFQTDLGENNKLLSPSSLTAPFTIAGSEPSGPYLKTFLSQAACPGPSCGYTATPVPSKAGPGGLSILIKIAPLLALVALGLALGLRLRRGT